jgi:mRNA interferase RelE/StbE
LKKIDDKDVKANIKQIILDCESYNLLWEIPELKKLQGTKNNYRIKTGDYGIGLKYENNIVTFERVLHRKDIYKYYP